MKVWYFPRTSLRLLVSILGLVLTNLLGFSHPTQAQEPFKIKKVVIDAGHGGKDPGCHGHNSREKEIALNISLDLGKKIKATYPDVEVIYTRETDVFVPLNERAAIANRKKADLFISIHCNHIGVRNRATGTETYVLGLHRAEDNLDVAKRENASILLEENYEKTYEGFDPYSPEGHIILSMYQNAHLERSILFGTYVENSVKQMSKLPSRGVKQAGFLVLRETTMPSVLIETGFLSTDLDEEYLTKRANQDEMASCILRAFGQYKKAVEEEESRTMAIVATVKDSIPVKMPPVTHGGVSKEGGIMIYRIQVAASSKSAVDARFQSLKDLEIIKEDDLYKFLVGYFTSHEAARPRLAELKANGFQGAFIVAYKDGRRIKA